MTRPHLRAWLPWVAFTAVHVWLAVANLPQVSSAYGDVRLVYPFWLEQAQAGTIVGIDVPWVYPIAAWLPILVAGVLGPEQLPVVWLGLVTALDGLALMLLLGASPGRGRARARRGGDAAAWTWLALLALLGPVAVGRIDSIATPIALAGVAAAWSGRTWLAAAAYTLGAWTKIWPGVLWLSQLFAARGRLGTLAAGGIVSAVVLGVALLLGAGANAVSFITWQSDRGLQIEAVVATPFHWLGTQLAYDDEQLTYQLLGDAPDAVAGAMTPTLVGLVLVLATLGVVAARRRADQETLTAWLATALATALIVCNSVGSPQFATWLTVPAVLLVHLREHATVVLIGGIALATQLIYPWSYSAVVGQETLGVVLLTVRNLGLVVLLAIAITRLGGLAAGRRGRRAATRRSGSR